MTIVRPAARGLLAAVAAWALSACGMQRALTVDTTPTGARIWVNGQERGTTPVRIPYVHDGLFTLRIEKDGYEPLAEEVRTETKLDAVPGIDLFAENLGPRRERVTSRTFALVPLKRSPYTDPEMDAILERAAEFRRRMDREVTEPGTPVPTRPPAAPSPTPTPAPPPPPIPVPAPSEAPAPPDAPAKPSAPPPTDR